MALGPGVRLTHYEVISLLGAGGMGEVYRARDHRLGRDVALKILPDSLANDRARLERLEREARSLAAIEHPGIASLYSLEEHEHTRFFVMELVRGETLATRLERGALPFDEALPIFLQIAEALEAAHQRGILHRDLKPGNIQITPQGRVKVLDFGLAKVLDEPSGDGDLAESPTRVLSTEHGVVLGTASYMSPEQARGKRLDKRSDIWSFGCVLYEALAGKKAFEGETVADALASIVKVDPDWRALPRDLPPGVLRLLRRCLRKNSEERLRDLGDALLELREATTEPTVTEVRRTPKAAWLVMAGIVLGAVATSLLFSVRRDAVVTRKPTARLSISLPVDIGVPFMLALSPDGRRLVFPGTTPTAPLHHRALDSSEVGEIAGSNGGMNPAFSPDGKWVAFGRAESLWKVPAEGGEAVLLASPAEVNVGLAWGGDGYLYYPRSYYSGIYRVASDGGEVEPVTELAEGDAGHWWPSVLPDGRALLFTVYKKGSMDSSSEMRIRDLRSGETRLFVRGGYTARYVASGHVLFGRSGSLLATAFHRERLVPSGEPIAVLKNVTTNPNNFLMAYSVSEEGTFVYAEERMDDELVWVSRSGETKQVTAERRRFGFPRVSPDGRKAVLVIREGVDRSLWLIDLDRGGFTRLTRGYDDIAPAWSSDAEWIYFTSATNGPYEIHRVRSDGGGEPELVLGGPVDKYAGSVSPDGKLLAFVEDKPADQKGGNDISLLSLDSGEIRPFATGPFNEGAPSFSPDGLWVAYQSDESGRWEVYLRRSDGRGGKIPVSVDGGFFPAWLKGSSEIVFRNGNRFESVTIPRDPTSGLGRPAAWFDASPFRGGGAPVTAWDTGPGGELLLVRTSDDSQRTELKIIMNWFDELRRLVPVD
jgi:serine/threonine-protein kinase